MAECSLCHKDNGETIGKPPVCTTCGGGIAISYYGRYTQMHSELLREKTAAEKFAARATPTAIQMLDGKDG